jgi:cohesin complex subunit SA-1/2
MVAEIFTSGESSDAIAAAWLRRYEEDNTASMTDLVNCVLKSTGCDMKVTEDDINDPDNAANKINDLQEEYKGVCFLFLLISETSSSQIIA